MGIRQSIVLVSLAVALSGCPRNMPMPTDGGAVVLPLASNGTTADPDREVANYACNGTATAPEGGADGSFDFHLIGFGSGDDVGNAHVYFFPDNVPALDCTGMCQDVTTNATGHVSVTAPLGGLYAYRVFPRTGATMASTYVDSVQINEIAPTGAAGAVEGNAVSVSTLNLIPAAFGFTRVEMTAIVAGEVQDCDGEAVRGAIVRLFAESGSEYISIPDVNNAPHIQYFDGNENPDGNTSFSQVDGLYAAANIPGPADGFVPVRAEAWAVITEGSAPVLVGCESVGIYGDGVSIVNLGPLRNDYPAGHPCAD